MAPIDQKLELLKHVPLFKDVSRHDLEQIGQLAEEVDVPAGQVLTREGAPRACGQNENQRKLCRAEQMHVPPVRSTRYDGNRMKREGASTNPLQPQRDRGLPRPRVLESPGRF